jgi:DNA-binding NtrC family response regulator
MTVALFGPNAELLDRVAAALASEGVEACPFAPPAAARMRELGEDFHKAVLVFLKHGAGETTQNVRRLLGDGRDLILCTNKLLDAKARELLTDADEGAAKVIAPRSPKAEHVAERILAQLILDGEMQPASCLPLYGATRVMRRVYEQIESYARVSDPVLILGETGTGKELVARALHRLSVEKSGRQDKFVPINCGDLEPELASSRLFGHKKGSFTGAIRDRDGGIVTARKGTFFLDEFGELEPAVQKKLLRVLEDYQVQPVGADEYVKVHARILLATNRDLEKECKEGRFRQDLYNRIRGFRIELPPLRDHRADIPLLARHLLALWNKEHKKSLEIPDDAFDCLFEDDWAEANLRGLRDAVRKAATLADCNGSRYVHPQSEKSEFERKAEPTFGKGFAIYCDPTTEKYKDFVKRARLSYLRSLLKATGGNRAKAIEISGLQHTQFYEYLKELEPDEE